MYLTIEGRNAEEGIELLDDVQEPSWTDIERHLRSIDGTQCTAITLHRDGNYLEVARVNLSDGPSAYVLTGSCERKAMVSQAGVLQTSTGWHVVNQLIDPRGNVKA